MPEYGAYTVLEAIGFDLAQAITHLISFLIALWLLKKFAWTPLLNLLDERRNKIKDEFDSIEDEKQNVQKLTAEYEEKLKHIDDERRAEIVKAVEEGKKIAADIKATAQSEAKELSDKTKKDLEREVAKAKVQLRDDMVGITVTAAEKVIHEKLDDTKHRQLIGRFIDGLEKV
ncbi:F0F1 ATP synthase subunit B [candidate division GN15 bacterium]|nr:F0F1 ATP synthase subunit B [candidate division GN15 bacterium]